LRQRVTVRVAALPGARLTAGMRDVGCRFYDLAVDSSDVVDPTDAALHQLLAQMAEHTGDERMRERIADLMLTLPPVAQWPPEMLEEWRQTYEYVRGLRREMERREVEWRVGLGGEEDGR